MRRYRERLTGRAADVTGFVPAGGRGIMSVVAATAVPAQSLAITLPIDIFGGIHDRRHRWRDRRGGT